MRCLRVLSRCGHCWSLATLVNKQLRNEEDPPSAPGKPSKKRVVVSDPLESLGKRVSTKLEEGDFKGSTCSEDSPAEKDNATLAALLSHLPLLSFTTPWTSLMLK